MNESAMAHDADLRARDAIADLADRVSDRGSFLRALLAYALDAARAGTRASSRGLAESLGVPAATLNSRAYRSGINLTTVFRRVLLIRAASILERDRVSVGMASLILAASSEQSLRRSFVTMTRRSVVQWRKRARLIAELRWLELYLSLRAAQYRAMDTPSFFARRIASTPHSANATPARAAS